MRKNWKDKIKINLELTSGYQGRKRSQIPMPGSKSELGMAILEGEENKKTRAAVISGPCCSVFVRSLRLLLASVSQRSSVGATELPSCRPESVTS